MYKFILSTSVVISLSALMGADSSLPKSLNASDRSIGLTGFTVIDPKVHEDQLDQNVKQLPEELVNCVTSGDINGRVMLTLTEAQYRRYEEFIARVRASFIVPPFQSLQPFPKKGTAHVDQTSTTLLNTSTN